MTIPKTTIALAEHEESDVGHQVLPDIKVAHLRRNPNHPAKLQEQMARRLGEEDPLAKMIRPGARTWVGKIIVQIVISWIHRLVWRPKPTFRRQLHELRIRQKNASHLFTIHQKKTEGLKDYVKRFNQVVLEVEDPSDKVVIMAMMEGLRPGPLFDSLSKNVLETLSTLQSKVDEYIATEELAKAKCKR
ncbi:hypothetical protein Acr_00g0046970 [Actinidia rufa]|uniref:Retrotransposon gag domain-containing protein n=1 Tax=Actinidia rufa TaxID=165716 RepID=A0A7J0DJU2_9ERIC|nr:hypothetical protein Acr_00g0046970 [Actinidia rufa]